MSDRGLGQKPLTADAVIELLDLAPLVGEGGYFRRTWASKEQHNGRPMGTAIFFLLKPGESSLPHRLVYDEIWHFYAGDPVELLQFGPNDSGSVQLLGNDLLSEQRPQVHVPGGAWQAARLANVARPDAWALMGTSMSPGYDQKDFELGDIEVLQRHWPQWGEWLGGLKA